MQCPPRLVLVCRCKQVPLDRRWVDLYAGRLNKTVDKDFWFDMYGGQRKHTLKQSQNCIISTPASALALSLALCLFGTKFTLNISKDQSESDKKPEHRAKDKTFIPLSFSLATFIYSLSVQLWGTSRACSKRNYIFDVQQVVFCDTAALLFFVVCVREKERKNCMRSRYWFLCSETFGLCTPTKAMTECLYISAFCVCLSLSLLQPGVCDNPEFMCALIHA